MFAALMGASGGIKMAIIGAVAAAVLTVIGGLYFQNSVLKQDVATLTANTAKQSAALAIQTGTIKAAESSIARWREAFKGQQQRMDELVKTSTRAATETRRLNDIFSKHNLTTLSRAKPGLVERRINAGTADVFSVFERITAKDIDGAR